MTKLTAEALNELERRARYNRGQMRLNTSTLLSLIAAARASLDSKGDAATLLKAVEWLSSRGHQSAAVDLNYNWNDAPPGDGSCVPLHLVGPAPSAAAAESMAGWVAVSERLPGDDVPVLGLKRHWRLPDTVIWEQELQFWTYCDGRRIDGEMTHWMPLPSLTKVTP
jgi:hypothetical protein